MARVNREREPGEKENRCLRRLKWNGANERGKFRGKINEPGVSGPRGTYTLMATANKRFRFFLCMCVCVCVCFEVDF